MGKQTFAHLVLLIFYYDLFLEFLIIFATSLENKVLNLKYVKLGDKFYILISFCTIPGTPSG